MTKSLKQTIEEVKEKRALAAVSLRLDDETLVETVYQPHEHRTLFCVAEGEKIRYEKELVVKSQRLVPYSPNNNLLKNEVVLLPSEPEEYGTEEELVEGIQAFIHRYVHVTPRFERLAAYYALFSWVFDSFNELPYLRLLGDAGSGKTRFLLTAGSLCYKPIFASGASTVSPIFRILDAFRGTLIVDEGDFRVSDEKAEIAKLLNQGNGRGFPILRSEVMGSRREFNPTAYAVFGPKIIATRGFFQDRALESRCLTEEMDQARLRDDIPINLPSSYKTESRQLRNKLLMFRFRNAAREPSPENLADLAIEPRLNQVLIPLLSIIRDQETREDLRGLARRYNQELIADRGMAMEGQVLEVIKDLAAAGNRLSIKEITSWFSDRHTDDYDRKITTKWIGYVIRKKLHLRTQKSHGVFVVPDDEKPKLERLFERYGVDAALYGSNEGREAPPELHEMK